MGLGRGFGGCGCYPLVLIKVPLHALQVDFREIGIRIVHVKSVGGYEESVTIRPDESAKEPDFFHGRVLVPFTHTDDEIVKMEPFSLEP